MAEPGTPRRSSGFIIRQVSAICLHPNFGKPYQAVFKYLFDQLHANPSDVVFVDDQRKNLDSAASLGFQTILFSPVEHNVTDAGISRDGTIWVVFDNGIHASICTGPAEALGTGEMSYCYPPVSEGVYAALSGGSVSVGNNKALVLDPFNHQLSDTPQPYVYGELHKVADATYLPDSAVTVDVIRTLHQYGVISITTHGTVHGESLAENVGFLTGERVTAESLVSHLIDLMNGLLSLGSIPSDGTYFEILPAFIYNYAQGAYPQSLVYLGACNSLSNWTMAAAFLNEGALTYLGFTETASARFNEEKARELFYEMVNNRKSVGQAFTDGEDPYWPGPIQSWGNAPARFEMVGEPDLRLLFPAGKIAFTTTRDGNRQIYIMNVGGSNQTNLSKNSYADYEPAWLPDGSKIAFTSYRYGNNTEIYVMNADGSNQTNLTNTPWGDFSPAWSPDGSKIAFCCIRDGNFDIYVMNVDGSNQTNLTKNPSTDCWPAWSPDGSKIAFCCIRDGNSEIYVMNVDGSNQTNLTKNPSTDCWPAWSPDGTRIAFMATRDGDWRIYVMNADGSNQVRLTNNPAGDSRPSWSPDGARIAFISSGDGNRDIYVINIDGSNQTRLTNDPAEDFDPAWSPIGR